MRKTTITLLLILMTVTVAAAQEIRPTNVLFVNEDVTSFIVSGETIKMMDLSRPADEIVGNQPGDNIVRIKPVKPQDEGTDMGIVTVVGERSISQFQLIYTNDVQRASSEYHVMSRDQVSYVNPEVDMDFKTMYDYAWAIWSSGKRFYDVSNKENRLEIRLNNIYTVGRYFFLDVSMYNRTKIQFDIDEIHIKLCDKKQMKRTSYQELEIKPVMTLLPETSFKKGYRNIFVIEKVTFPDEKVLSFCVNEKPVSGRSITLNIDYGDVLSADSFDRSLMQMLP